MAELQDIIEGKGEVKEVRADYLVEDPETLRALLILTVNELLKVKEKDGKYALHVAHDMLVKAAEEYALKVEVSERGLLLSIEGPKKQGVVNHLKKPLSKKPITSFTPADLDRVRKEIDDAAKRLEQSRRWAKAVKQDG